MDAVNCGGRSRFRLAAILAAAVAVVVTDGGSKWQQVPATAPAASSFLGTPSGWLEGGSGKGEGGSVRSAAALKGNELPRIQG